MSFFKRVRLGLVGLGLLTTTQACMKVYDDTTFTKESPVAAAVANGSSAELQFTLSKYPKSTRDIPEAVRIEKSIAVILVQLGLLNTMRLETSSAYVVSLSLSSLSVAIQKHGEAVKRYEDYATDTTLAPALREQGKAQQLAILTSTASTIRSKTGGLVTQVVVLNVANAIQKK